MRLKFGLRGSVLAAVIAVGGIAVAAMLSPIELGAQAAPQVSPPAKKVTLATTVDLHGYPRTYHLYGYGPVDEIARYDMIVGYRWFDIAGLRERNPNGIFLLQPSLVGSNGLDAVGITTPGGAVGWPGATDRSRNGAPLGTIPPVDPEWDLLHNADGSIEAMGSVLGWNLAAPTGKASRPKSPRSSPTQQKTTVSTARFASASLSRSESRCWNGVHSDNWIYTAIGASWFYGPNLDTNRDGVVDNEVTLKRNWANGLTLAGKLIRSYLPQMIVGGNGVWYESNTYAGSDPKGWLKASNYTLIEDMQKFSPATCSAAANTWLTFHDPLGQPRYMAALQQATDINGNVLMWTQGDPNTAASMDRPDVLRSMRWGLTLSLMTGVYYEIIGNFYGNSQNCRWWFDGMTAVSEFGVAATSASPSAPIRKPQVASTGATSSTASRSTTPRLAPRRSRFTASLGNSKGRRTQP